MGKFAIAFEPTPKVLLKCSGTGRTKQSFKDQCDVNKIMDKFVRTQTIDFVNKHGGSYGDFSGFDFQNAQDVVAKANEMFADMPSQLRKRFNNEPAEFLSFIADEDNRLEAEKLGLLKPVIKKEAVPIVTPGASGTPLAGSPAVEGVPAPASGGTPQTSA